MTGPDAADETGADHRTVLIRQLQDTLLSMLDAVDDSVGPDGYVLAYGTALGALRSGDFIAWDIDADLLVPWDRYGHVIDVIASTLPRQLRVHAAGQPGYEHLFARVGYRGVDHKLIRVDLFPLAVGPDSRIMRRAYTLVQRIFYAAVLCKAVRLSDKRHYGRRKAATARIAKALLIPIPMPVLHSAFRRFVSVAAARSSGATLTNPCGSYGAREYFAAEWFAGAGDVSIRGHRFCVPSGVESILTSIYGNYAQQPPDEQISREFDFVTEHYLRPLQAAGWFDRVRSVDGSGD